MNQTIKITSAKTPFERMEVPEFRGEYLQQTTQFPTALQFNTTMYMYQSATNELKAVRVMALAFESSSSLLALVQFPGDVPFWCNDIFNNPMFTSKEHFFEYTTGNARPINFGWECVYYVYPDYRHAAVVSLKNFCWSWVKGTASIGAKCPPIHYFLITEDGTYACVGKDYYTSREECVKANLNGLVIDDFADEEVFAIKTIVLPATQKTHILRFVEE
jgi:hypothetical protein